MLLVHDHLLLFIGIPYDVHLVSRWIAKGYLLAGLLVHEAELLLLAKHLLLLCSLGLCLLEDVIVLGTDLVLEELLVGVLVLHEHEVRLLLLLRQLQPILLLLQALQLHLQPLALGEEAHPAALLELFCTELWQVVHEAVVVGNHRLLKQLLGQPLWRRLVSLLEDIVLRSYYCQHTQGPLSLWDVLPHELGQPPPLLLLLLAGVGPVLLDDPHHLVPENLGRRWVAAGKKLDVAVLGAVALPHVHLLQQNHQKPVKSAKQVQTELSTFCGKSKIQGYRGL